VTAFDILLALMLSICGTKGSVMTAKQTPWVQGSGNTWPWPGAGPCRKKGQIGQSDRNDWPKEHTAGAIDYHNPYRSEHLNVEQQALISPRISAITWVVINFHMPNIHCFIEGRSAN